MNAEVKKCADANDIKGLRYIFVDCLDVDPTFDTYREDYEYCKRLSGFLEGYTELTPLRMEASEWNEDYWVKLKVDLLKNFAEIRFSHMIEVVKVLKADKIKRLHRERNLAQEAVLEKKTAAINRKPAAEQQKRQSFNADAQQRALKEAQRELELENRRTQAEIERKEKERAERAARLKEEEALRNRRKTEGYGDSSPKKAVGIVVFAIIILLIILLVFILR